MVLKENIDEMEVDSEWENAEEIEQVKQETLNLLDEVHDQWVETLHPFFEDEEE